MVFLAAWRGFLAIKMGTNMTAFIEYDQEYADRLFATRARQVPFQDLKELPPPFAPNSNVVSLTTEEGLYTGGKDYTFFGAVSGVRNRIDLEPLFLPRGLPPVLSMHLKWAVIRDVFDGLSGVGWLTLEEINAAFDHQAVNRDYLSNEALAIMDVMGALEKRFGLNRVRLIFGFD